MKGGYAFGETDEFGINIVANPVHVHDYHATILHLMGIDHTKLVYRYAGRDFRLTDVDGNVVTAVAELSEPATRGCAKGLQSAIMDSRRCRVPNQTGPPIQPLFSQSIHAHSDRR